MPKTTKETTEKKDKKLNSTGISRAKKNSTSKTTTKSKSVSKKTPSTSKKAKTVASKKSTTKKTPSKKTTKQTTKASKQKLVNVLEYYDLPYRYNETTVKMLAQTPKTLFVYWEISDSDRENYIKQYGSDFFEKTKPVLIIYNATMNYNFEIEINDFANCWYFNINDEKCEYYVELGRRFKENSTYAQIPNNYLFITSSNKIESPNGHILFEKNQNVVFYKDVKTNKTFSKDIANFEFIKYFGKIYNIYDVYKKIYKEDEFLQRPNNPTSY